MWKCMKWFILLTIIWALMMYYIMICGQQEVDKGHQDMLHMQSKIDAMTTVVGYVYDNQEFFKTQYEPFYKIVIGG